MAISSPRDGNRVAAVLVTSNADGLTPMNVKVDATHNLLASDGLGGSGFSSINTQRDANRIPVIWGISAADGVTPIPIYGNPATGEILIRTA